MLDISPFILKIITFEDLFRASLCIGLGLGFGWFSSKIFVFESIDFGQYFISLLEQKTKVFREWLKFEYRCALKDIEEKK